MSPPTSLVIRNAVVAGVPVDLRVRDGRIASMGTGLQPSDGDHVLDARGGPVLPGLHDHHVHLRALVAARRSVSVGPLDVRGARGLADAIIARSRSLNHPDEWVRAVGYHESVAGDIDRRSLDGIVGDRPVRVQHRSGVLWILNSAALKLVGEPAGDAGGMERGADGEATGRLWRMDAWLAARLAATEDRRRDPGWLAEGLASIAAEAAAAGVTGWTDATPGRDEAEAAELTTALRAASVAQRVCLMAPAGVGTAGLDAGPFKVMLDDDRLPSLERLSESIAASHRAGRSVAVHCVTRTQLVMTLAAFESAGPASGDRIEHGAVIPSDLLATVRRLRLIVVTQPNFVAERGDEYLAGVDDADLAYLWPGRSLVEAGIPVAAGTDAPFGGADPWVAIRAAVRRRTPSGRLLGGHEAVDLATAVGWWTGDGNTPARRRRVAPGEVADLIVLGVRLADVASGDGPVPVVATVIGGRIVHRA